PLPQRAQNIEKTREVKSGLFCFLWCCSLSPVLLFLLIAFKASNAPQSHCLVAHNEAPQDQHKTATVSTVLISVMVPAATEIGERGSRCGWRGPEGGLYRLQSWP